MQKLINYLAAAAQQQSQQLLNTILQQQSQQQTLLQTMMPYGQATNPLYSMMVQPNVSKAATGYQTISPGKEFVYTENE
jgi:hypothetical protein